MDDGVKLRKLIAKWRKEAEQIAAEYFNENEEWDDAEEAVKYDVLTDCAADVEQLLIAAPPLNYPEQKGEDE